MERIDEFVVDRIINNSEWIRELFCNQGFEKEYKLIKNLDDFHNCQEEFIDLITDLIDNYLNDQRETTHDPGGDEWFGGGDESVFENGEYCWEYHEFEGWCYYVSPEGDYKGLNRIGDSILPF